MRIPLLKPVVCETCRRRSVKPWIDGYVTVWMERWQMRRARLKWSFCSVACMRRHFSKEDDK